MKKFNKVFHEIVLYYQKKTCLQICLLIEWHLIKSTLKRGKSNFGNSLIINSMCPQLLSLMRKLQFSFSIMHKIGNISLELSHQTFLLFLESSTHINVFLFSPRVAHPLASMWVSTFRFMTLLTTQRTVAATTVTQSSTTRQNARKTWSILNLNKLPKTTKST